MGYNTAGVKVMRSFDYCHFEIQLGWNSAENNGAEIEYENVDELRKEAARLVDKAVNQYRIMKERMDFINSSEYDWNRLQTRLVKLHKENPDKTTWTPEMKALEKRFNDLDFNRGLEYDYQDDWNDRYEPYDYPDDETPF